MITAVRPYTTQSRQRQNFGSFDIPKTAFDARRLGEKAVANKLLPTPDNIESLRKALKEGGKSVQIGLEDLAKIWGKDPNELRK